MTIDIHFNKDKGYFDFNFGSNGDFETTQGLDTSLLMSIYVDKRASSSEAPMPEMRRGWWGNLVGNYVNYEIGSKLWLLIQSRKNSSTLNLAKTYAFDCLKWMIEDQIVTRIEVTDSFSGSSLLLNVVLYRGQSIVFSNAYVLWNNTQRIS
jgi:phage gp46-like protein